MWAVCWIGAIAGFRLGARQQYIFVANAKLAAVTPTHSFYPQHLRQPTITGCKTSTITSRQRTTITSMQKKVHNHILTSTKNHHHNNAKKSPQSHTHNMQNWQQSHQHTPSILSTSAGHLLCITPESVIENHYVVKRNTFDTLPPSSDTSAHCASHQNQL